MQKRSVSMKMQEIFSKKFLNPLGSLHVRFTNNLQYFSKKRIKSKSRISIFTNGFNCLIQVYGKIFHQYLQIAEAYFSKIGKPKSIRILALYASNYNFQFQAYRSEKNFKYAFNYLMKTLELFFLYSTEENPMISWEEYEKDYLEKNKDFYSQRELDTHLYFYKIWRDHSMNSFLDNLQSIEIAKEDYTKLILSFEKYYKNNPRAYAWCQEFVQKIRILSNE